MGLWKKQVLNGKVFQQLQKLIFDFFKAFICIEMQQSLNTDYFVLSGNVIRLTEISLKWCTTNVDARLQLNCKVFRTEGTAVLFWVHRLFQKTSFLFDDLSLSLSLKHTLFLSVSFFHWSLNRCLYCLNNYSLELLHKQNSAFIEPFNRIRPTMSLCYNHFQLDCNCLTEWNYP